MHRHGVSDRNRKRRIQVEGGSELPEFDRCETRGCISPLRRFDNSVGHFVDRAVEGNDTKKFVLSYDPEIFADATLFREALVSNLKATVRRGRLWSPLRCVPCTQNEDSSWMCSGMKLDPGVSTALELFACSFLSPLSAHSQHAWLECLDSKDATKTFGVYSQPEETTGVPGSLGTTHNSQIIDLVKEDANSYADMGAREAYLDDYDGFLDHLHTPHSGEAGRVRRVCQRDI